MARTAECQFVLGNNSGELLVLNKRKLFDNDADDINRNDNVNVPCFSLIQTIKLSSDEHITSIDCSKTIKPRMIAVGRVNGLSILISEQNQWRKHKEIAIPRTSKNSNIIWALVFV